MRALVSGLKNADHLERRRIMNDLAAMEAEKAAAERAWAMENQALTSQEIAGHQYMVQAKEEADRRFNEQTTANGMAQKQQLYTDLNQEAASIKVHGDAITRQKAYEAEQRQKMSQQLAQVEGDLEKKVGKEKLQGINQTIQKVQEQSDFEKLNAEQVAMFKAQVLKGDLDSSMAYWSELRVQANAGYVTSLEQFDQYSAQMQREAAELRAALAYAMNPAQTGSPSLNMEMAAGFTQTQQIMYENANAMIRKFAAVRDSAAITLGGLGAMIIGNPTPGVAPTSPGNAPAAGITTSGGSDAAPVSVQAPISITITGGIPSGTQATELANTISDTLAKKIGQAQAKQIKKHGRARGVRSPGFFRNGIIPT